MMKVLRATGAVTSGDAVAPTAFSAGRRSRSSTSTHSAAPLAACTSCSRSPKWTLPSSQTRVSSASASAMDMRSLYLQRVVVRAAAAAAARWGWT